MLLLRNIIVLVFSLMFLVGGGGCLYADQLLNKIDFVSPDSGGSGDATDSMPNGLISSGTAKAGIVGGLYHDDAVMNILLLGTDDYQSNDVGRSDSMMLVSVDTRHKKLKVTSLMRDLYVAIPGYGSNKLNAAYSLPGGKEKGAHEVVSTVEANFGVDINRFVIVDFTAFPKIIDSLGGVEIELSKETNSSGENEADLINTYSGDSKKVHTGVNNLTGLQARYYSRIRAIGDDYERTERQRKGVCKRHQQDEDVESGKDRQRSGQRAAACDDQYDEKRGRLAGGQFADVPELSRQPAPRSCRRGI
jgi:LCP family protein required for cell wall assembly